MDSVNHTEIMGNFSLFSYYSGKNSSNFYSEEVVEKVAGARRNAL